MSHNPFSVKMMHVLFVYLPSRLCCIAPVLAARCIPGVHVTVGADSGTAEAIVKMGAVHESRNITVRLMVTSVSFLTKLFYYVAASKHNMTLENASLI